VTRHPFDLEPGARLGPYELCRPLGEGGTSEVWEAFLHGPGGFRKPVALKMLRHDQARSDVARAMLLREARTGARLTHPNVVSTLLVGEHEGVICVALELVRGCTTSRLLASHGPLPGGALLDIGVQAADALHHVHRFILDGAPAGLVHRDVKPSNLLVDRAGRVQLVDLGITYPQGDEGPCAGTPGYAPPEQQRGEATPKSDLFGLGATLWVLATKRRLFGRGAEALEAVWRVEDALASRSFQRQLDDCVPGLADVVRRCLRLNPSERPRDAREVAASLRELRATSPSGPALAALVRAAEPTELSAPPSAAETDTIPHPSSNLRPADDRFVGRRRDLRALRAAVLDHRWVVLLGPGGMGKTRLALELARELQHEMVGGAWAFDLTEARSADGICRAVAGALGVGLDPRDPVAQLGRILAAKGRCFIVLDNLEQCVSGLEATLGAWRKAAPQAHILGTSRVRPGLPAEHGWVLDPLTTDDAATLFHARAPRALSADEASRIATLCAALDHMPLSIELAAARVRVLPVAEIERRIGLELLRSRDTDRPARHRSVQASLQWSLQLLSPAAAEALAQLSVFDGGFDLSAAETVLSLGPDAPWALDVLQELVDASLLRVDPEHGRFRAWGVVRAFGTSLLSESDRLEAEIRHGSHYATMDGQSPEALREIDNLVVACRRAARRGDLDVACRTLAAAGTVLTQIGPASLSIRLARDVHAAAAGSPWSHRSGGLLGRALWRAGDLADAETHLTMALEQARQRRDPRREAWIELTLGNVWITRGRPEQATGHLQRSQRLHRSMGDRTGEGHALGALGMACFRQGDSVGAKRHIEAALEVYREHGARRFEGHQLGNLGLVCNRLGDKQGASEHLEAGLRIHQAVGDRRAEGLAWTNLGALQTDLGRDDEAQRSFVAARTIQQALGNLRVDAVLCGNLGSLSMRQGRLDDARAQFEEAIALHQRVGSGSFQGIVLGNLGVLCAEQGLLHEARGHFQRALALLEPVADEGPTGRVRLQLARLDALQGNRAQAALGLVRGEEQVRASDDLEGIVIALAVRADVLAAAGHAVDAEKALQAAEADLRPGQADARAAIARARAHLAGTQRPPHVS